MCGMRSNRALYQSRTRNICSVLESVPDIGYLEHRHEFSQANPTMSAIFQRDPRANLLLGGGERVSGQDVRVFKLESSYIEAHAIWP